MITMTKKFEFNFEINLKNVVVINWTLSTDYC